MFIRSFLQKIAVSIINKHQFYLVRVCAWCPKEGYPKLHTWQKYTHGICERHYMELTAHKQKRHNSLQENIDKLNNFFFPRNQIV